MKNLKKRKEIKTDSPIEDIVLREFHLLGFYPIPQFQIGKYRVDFAFPDMMVVIECDGKEWHSSEEQLKNDKVREDYLKDMGWEIVRITGSDIYKNADEIIGVLTGKKKSRREKRYNIRKRLDQAIMDGDSFPSDLIEEERVEKKMVDEFIEAERDALDKKVADKPNCGFSLTSDIIKERYKNGIN